MQNLAIVLDAGCSFTLLSNCFIDNYIKDANDVQLKVYICLLRGAASARGISMNDLVEFLNYSEKDVIRALRYWEKKGLLVLSSDSGRKVSGDDTLISDETISGIQLITPQPPSVPQQPAVHEDRPAALSLVRNSPAHAPGSHSLADMKEFRNDPANRCLITAATAYLGRPLSEPEFSSLLYYSKDLGFSPELTDYLLQYCIGEGKKSFHYIDKVALSWAEENVRTPDEARALICSHEDEEAISRILKVLGRVGKLAPEEGRLVRRWLHKYAFPIEVIEEALTRSVIATDHNRIPYAEKILKSWHDLGVRSLEDAKEADAAFRAEKEASRPVASSRKRSGGFADIEQHDYDFSELEKKLIDN
ncbi:MAG: DnaD domain protein [Lachnospiraceae bacterium]|nr:DnaD domain protein [Lachnospiraceae bacterium]